MGINSETQLASAGIHLEPRRSRPEDPQAQLQPETVEQQQQQPDTQPFDKDSFSIPYPRWSTLFTRGVLALFETAVLVYAIWYLKKWESDPKFTERDRGQALSIGTAAAAMGLDLSACLLTLFKKYGAWCGWVLVTIGDVAVGVAGILGTLGTVVWVDHNGFSREELGWFWEDDMAVLGTLCVVIGVTHFLASIGGCAGCCIVGRRPTAPRGPRR